MVDTVRVAGRIRMRGLGFAAIVAAIAVLISACAGTGYNYVKDSGDKTYLKVPDSWKLFSHEQILSKNKNLSKADKQSQLDSSWQVIFDADPKPALKHFLAAASSHPAGMALVLQLSFNASDTLALKDLRNFFIDIDTASQNNTGNVLTYEPLTIDGGFHGIHLVATVTDSKGRSFTFDQKAVLDQDTSKAYLVIVGCQSDCYQANQDKIENVVDSWTVRQ
jgi:hypothetical protein